jgi:hypothetical protein
MALASSSAPVQVPGIATSENGAGPLFEVVPPAPARTPVAAFLTPAETFQAVRPFPF